MPFEIAHSCAVSYESDEAQHGSALPIAKQILPDKQAQQSGPGQSGQMTLAGFDNPRKEHYSPC
ncbi:hypothetical protein OW296_001978 [Salmonella enterica]|nr:hypothetical protein [Salmonella enterica]EJH2873112.1 hypothetical protein [Salmonella enterica]EJX5309740.1 hypothetical protein [Salmonella enterica]EKE8888637.1 hypothetical protein [Salmonella enterica]